MNSHKDESRAVLFTQNVHNMFVCIAAHLYKQLKSTQYDNSVHNAGTNYAACPAANSHYVVTTPRRDCHLSTLPARPAPPAAYQRDPSAYAQRADSLLVRRGQCDAALSQLSFVQRTLKLELSWKIIVQNRTGLVYRFG